MRRLLLLSLLLGCASQVPPPSPAPSSTLAPYQAAIDQILATNQGDRAYRRLQTLTDGIGHRLSGSPALERAVDWAAEGLKQDGLLVARQPVQVPHWVRGEARAELRAPIQRPIALLALGSSPSTPAEGLVAQVLVVSSFDELKARAAEVPGKIVLFDVPMTHDAEGPGYGAAVAYRGHGPSAAAKLGALAALVRSVTERSLRTPHTGSTHFDEGVKPIPAAAITIEDASLIHRLFEQGPVELSLSLKAQRQMDAPSANVIADLPGLEKPEEVVLLGAHLDSWDVGQGAHDDGAGCVIVMEALATLQRLNLIPKRTVRVVLYTNEENGGAGAQAYRKAFGDKRTHVAALEADTGGFRPLGFRVESEDPTQLAWVRELAQALAPLGATEVKAGHSGADVAALQDSGALLLGLSMEISSYFDYHHSEADTLDKVDAADLQADVAAVAVLAYLLASVDRPAPSPTPVEAKPQD